jgi:small subunit ribosomal protein S16
MLKIRMQRVGRINQPSYRIIVVEHTESPKTGSFVDVVGTYDPRSKARNLDEAKIKGWMAKGAKPSATVHNMLVSAGILSGKKINVLPKYVEPAKEEAPAAEAVPSEMPAEEKVETPAAEVAPAEEKAEAASDLPAEASAQAGTPVA